MKPTRMIRVLNAEEIKVLDADLARRGKNERELLPGLLAKYKAETDTPPTMKQRHLIEKAEARIAELKL